jgi:beta-phosphoglucomutase-like phosphatase (HAD superfamily)
MQQIDSLTIIDFDGTILDSSKAWLNVYQTYCNKNNSTIPELTTNLKLYSFSYSDCLEAIKSTYNITTLTNEIITSVSEISKEIYNNIPPKKGFAEFIKTRQLSKSKTIIVSREDPNLIKSYLKYHQIIEVLEVFQDCSNNRRNIDFYSDFSRVYSCKTQNITLIDDSFSHCSAAKQSGVFVVGMNDNHSIDRIKQMTLICDLYLNDFTALLKL